ncbi:hypothetical protein [Methanococcus maripaludis]|uniref:PIN domain-containing protein n=1 Tax=Methanococcus maripaludis TaxID=39152 RepID=A0A2L1C8M5_METMI|nr:hypothetical protein [Methanococcus maripaludis]AVB75653.1 hypothetical protein MMJJ_02340 [Methanococcus maripaludis]
MDIFLDSCIIFGKHIPKNPHNDNVNKFYCSNNILSQTSCDAVKDEVNYKLKKVIIEAYGDDVSELLFREIRLAINHFFKKINMVNYQNHTNYDFIFLYDELEDYFKKLITKNTADKDIFSNVIVWGVDKTLNNPNFITTDKRDYTNKFDIIITSNKCLSANNYPNTPIKIQILK